MDVSQYLQGGQQITFHTDAAGKAQDYPCTVKKIKENLIAVVLQSKLKDSPVCSLGTKITLKWTTDNKPYSLFTAIVQNKTFPLVVLNQHGEIIDQSDQGSVTPAESPEATPTAIDPKAPPEKPKNVKAFSYYSHAEKKPLDLETFEYLRDLINEVPQLYSLGPNEVISLVSYVSYKSVEKGDFIFKEGEAGDCLFYIASGAVDIIKESVEGNPIKLDQLTQNSMMGEMALMDNAPRSATAEVVDDVELIIITRESFEGLLKDVPVIGIKIFKQIATTISQRLRFANGRLADVINPAHQEGIVLEDEEDDLPPL